MSEELNIYEQLEAYIEGSMDGEEKKLFDQALASDPELARQLETHAAIHELVVDAALIDLKKKLNTRQYDRGSSCKGWWWGLGLSVLTGAIFYAIWASDSTVEKSSLPNASIISPNRQNQDEEKAPETNGISSKNPASLVKPDIATQSIDNTPVVAIDSNSRTPLEQEVLKLTSGNETKEPLPSKLSEETPARIENRSAVAASFKLSDTDKKDAKKSLDYMFQPNLGEVWAFPIGEQEMGEVKIYNMAGKMVFESKVGPGYSTHWNGIDPQGGLVGAGNYVYQISLENEKVIQGYVTVVH